MMCCNELDFSIHPCKPLKCLRETADTAGVENRVRVLKEMVASSLYVVDEQAVANAILARAAVHRAIAEPELRSSRSDRVVRSFRRTRNARSFRLMHGPAGVVHHHHHD
jgi:hypothetical protein